MDWAIRERSAAQVTAVLLAWASYDTWSQPAHSWMAGKCYWKATSGLWAYRQLMPPGPNTPLSHSMTKAARIAVGSEPRLVSLLSATGAEGALIARI